MFLSFNSRDREAVNAFREALEVRAVRSFFDAHSIAPGTQWQDALSNAIRTCHATVVFVGPHGLGLWQKRELGYANLRQVAAERSGSRPFPIVPLFLPGYDPEAAPPFLLLNHGFELVSEDDRTRAADALAQITNGAAPPPEHVVQGGVRLTASPYRGLRSFREEDAALFYGRDAFADRLLDKVRTENVVAVVGGSGSGKSSVVHAGLIPRLRREPSSRAAWDVITFTPGIRPYHSLAAALVAMWQPNATDRIAEAERLGSQLEGSSQLDLALAEAIKASPGTDRLLLVVDQFEEIFTLAKPPDGAKASSQPSRTPQDFDPTSFVATLLSAANTQKVTVLIILRADFYGKVVELSRSLSDRLERGQVNLGPMTPEELCQAIEGPARSAKLHLDDGLADVILADVNDQAGSLPLVEFTLSELFERGGRNNSALRMSDYRKLGGVRGAVSRRADDVLETLTPARRTAARRLFGRLVRVGTADGVRADTRQRAQLSDLDGAEREVARKFVDARLLVIGAAGTGGTELVEVAHEALFRHWPVLVDWIEKDRTILAWTESVLDAALAWESGGRAPGLLWHGEVLRRADRLAKDRADRLTTLAKEFIGAGLAERRGQAQRRLLIGILALDLAGAAAVGRSWFLNRKAYQFDQALERGLDLHTTPDPRIAEEWTRALVLSDHVAEARVQIDRWREPGVRSGATIGMAEGLTEVKRADEAKPLAQQAIGLSKDPSIASAPYYPGMAPTIVAAGLVRNKMKAESIEMIQHMPRTAGTLNWDYEVLALALADETSISETIQLARSLDKDEINERPPRFLPAAITVIARTLAQSDEHITDAIDLVKQAEPDAQRYLIWGLASSLRLRGYSGDAFRQMADLASTWTPSAFDGFGIDRMQRGELMMWAGRAAEALHLAGDLTTPPPLTAPKHADATLGARSSADIQADERLLYCHRLIRAARLYADLGNRDSASKILRQALDGVEAIPPEHGQRTGVFYEAVVVQSQLGDRGAAMDSALKGQTDFFDRNHEGQMRALVERHLTGEARSIAQGLAEHDSKCGALGIVAKLALRQGRIREAIEIAESMDHSAASSVWADIAIAQARRGALKESLATSERSANANDKLKVYGEILLEEAAGADARLGPGIRRRQQLDEILNEP